MCVCVYIYIYIFIYMLIKTEYTVIIKSKNISTTVFLNFHNFSCLQLKYIYVYMYIYYIYRALKVVSSTFLLVCSLSPKESSCETLKNVFYFTIKPLSIIKKTKFSILDIQISWRHQMTRNKTLNTFCWITSEVNRVCLASLCYITKEKNYQKILQK